MNRPREVDTLTVAETLGAAIAHFSEVHDNPHLDAQVLLAHVLKCDRAWLFAHADAPLAPSQRSRFRALTDRRMTGEPVAYLTGHREFWSLDLTVTPAVLIPRPETELLVEVVLEHLRKINLMAGTLVDLGTGSGAIALALACELPGARIMATDRCLAALKLARDNAARHGLDHLGFITSDWCAALAGGRYQAICSNPPYIAATDPHLNRGDVRFEPREALCAGHDGLRDLARIIDQAARCLVRNGHLFLEHGADQGQPVRQLLTRHGYRHIHSVRDLAGHERVTRACHPGTATL